MTEARKFSFGAFVVETAFLDDILAFALGDGTVRLVEGETTSAVQVHSGAVLSAAPTLDGKSLVTGGDDGRVALTGANGIVDVVFERPRKWIDSVAAGPRGAIACASGRQVTAKLGDGRERDLALDRTAGGLAFAPRGLRLAVAGFDGVTLWWPATDAAPTRLKYKGAHLTASFAPDGRFLVTTMQENALHAWRVEDGLDMHMSGYPAKTRSLAWTARGRHLATSGAPAAVLWPFQAKDGPRGKDPIQLAAGKALVTRVASHPREERLAVGYQDGSVVLVELAGRTEIAIHSAGVGPLSALCFDPRGNRLAFGTEDGAAGIISLAS